MTWRLTNGLRWAVYKDEAGFVTERLQQAWQSDEGEIKWLDVEKVKVDGPPA